LVVATIRTLTEKNYSSEFRVRSRFDPFSLIFFYLFWDSGAPIVALEKPRTLEGRKVYLKHFIVNFFESNTSNRINDMDSADKKWDSFIGVRRARNISEKKGKTDEKVSFVNSVVNHP